MQETPDIKDLLEKYIQGKCSVEEIVLLKKWFELVQQMNSKRAPLSNGDENRMVEKLYASSRFSGTAEYGLLPGKRKFQVAYGIAAAGLGVLIGCAWLLFRPANKPVVTAAVRFAYPAITTVTAGVKQQKKIVLPDGSTVYLNAGSVISYTADFKNNRHVQLQGEAFFSVVKDAAHPFKVQAGKATMAVYGTAFNVYAYPAVKEMRVGLQSGKIGVQYDSAGNRESVLKPGQLLVYNKTTGKQNLHLVPPAEMNGWAKGKLVFYKTPLAELFYQLQLHYGVQVVYTGDDNGEKLITARFSHMPLPMLLRHLSFGWGFVFSSHRDTLYIK